MRFTSSLLLSVLLASPVWAKTEAFEVGQHNIDQLPGGREADGIAGDFILRNDRVVAVISGNLPTRKANMATFWEAVTPGCIYDFCPRGSRNDQLTYFGPGRQAGPLSSVRIIKTGEDGEAVLRAELTDASGNGLGKTHDYILRDDWNHVVVVSTYHNATRQTRSIRVSPEATGLTQTATVEGITVGECQDPADRLGYAFAPMKFNDAEPALGKTEIPPGETRRYAAVITVGAGAAEAFGIVKQVRGEPTRRITGRVLDAAGKPATAAQLLIAWKGEKLAAFVRDDGGFDLLCPPEIRELRMEDLGRPDQTVKLDGQGTLEVQVKPASGVEVKITDDKGGKLPCKLQFIPLEGTVLKTLGPKIRAHGCTNQYHSENGSFTQALPPGKYRVIVTRGIEYDHADRTIEVPAGKTVKLDAQLHRIMNTPGWVSTDFHNHSTPSGDNYCGTDDRLINLAAEGVEFAPTTEHNRVYDWQPHITRLGLQPFLATIVGMELTGGGPHLNAFPLEGVPYTQDNGAPQWDPDPRISALLLRRHRGDKENRWVQLNHPSVSKFFNDSDGDRKADGGFANLESFIDAAEVYSEGILSPTPMIEINSKRGKRIENKAFSWLQMLNAGRRVWMISVSDAHEVTEGGVGGWRTYVQSRRDEPPQIDYRDIIRNAKAGRSFVTTGPFLEVQTPGRKGPGDTIGSRDPITLHVRVQCNTWTDIDRVAVLVNGKLDPSLDFRRADKPEMFSREQLRFEQDITVPLDRDAHLVVVAIGEGSNLKTGYGESWQSEMHPLAYHNPIFVDVDGDGFTPNKDTLGHPFLRANE